MLNDFQNDPQNDPQINGITTNDTKMIPKYKLLFHPIEYAQEINA